ncbi:hypothetical protein [Gordoniibacillus kamchatkensis]|uniref:hypothetical protein n=1 Tax=Gordoniibacillus kamchatkensis TaxID=1590651 RepID=UPI0018CF5E03|nr:hypothetical protein [Paenibacillus sp. VKM B-2647]
MYTIIATEQFEKDIKFYKRKKKFNHIEDDVDEVIKELQNGNLIGDEIPNLKLPEMNHHIRLELQIQILTLVSQTDID